MGNKAGKIALGLGLVTGAVTGLLFAPDEGKNIRKKIAKGDTKALLKDLEEMAGEMRDMVADFAKRPEVQETLENAKDKTAELAHMKREELDEMLKKANKKAEEFKKTVSKYVKEQKTILESRLAKNKAGKKKAGKKKASGAKATGAKAKSTKKAPKKK